MVLLLIQTLFQDEGGKVAHGSSFLVAAFDERLKRVMRNRDGDPFRCSGNPFFALAIEGNHHLVAANLKYMLCPLTIKSLIGT